MDPASDLPNTAEYAVFATLTPANTLARLAFSDTCDALTAGRQASCQGPLGRMQVEPAQVLDKAVAQLKRELQRRLSQSDGYTSDSLTDPFSEDEAAATVREMGMIWTGRHLLGFNPNPSNPDLGLVAGKGRLPLLASPDLVLCTAGFAKKHGISLRTTHARFNFNLHNRALFIAGHSRSQHAELTVNGVLVNRQQFALNQYSMAIEFDKLKYLFQWTDWAATPAFNERRVDYLTGMLRGPQVVDFEMPTPLSSVRTIGSWTLSEPLGRGGMGRVFLASNSTTRMAAVKVVERNRRTRDSVDREVRTFRELTALIKKCDVDGRIVQLLEIIGYPEDRDSLSSWGSFQEVAIVMDPVARSTFSDLTEPSQSNGTSKGMPVAAGRVFRDALMSAKILHDWGWLHGDLKPANIGVIGASSAQQRAVLLDVGHAVHLGPGSSLRPRPCTGGTLDYLAPEREMENYDYAVDIWGLGIVGFQLTYGRHPWRFARNPWRHDRKGDGDLRRDFMARYDEAMDMLASHAREAQPSPDHIQLGSVLMQMLRHRWAPKNSGRRISIDEALEHPAWGPLLSDASREPKRQKFGDRLGMEDR
ncbi:hypothetical protein RB593_007307 [Gaeumannomyces tritici]